MIRIEGLNKYYYKGKSNELHIINNTTVTFPDSGLVCILGESGSGKTTFMNVIGGLDDFDEGIIEADGIQINKSSRRDKIRNEKFSYIFQNYYLLTDRTAEYNIKMALSMHELSDEEKEERVDYVLKAVDMLKYKKKLVSQLSGGQQQRIGIARALVKSPKVIFADEPTGNLDEANTIKIMKILKKISKSCLVVLVTHEQTIADFFADKIIRITDGCIEKEIEGKGESIYQYEEDSNFYLREYSIKKLKKGNVELEVYGEAKDTKIFLVYDNDKLYISAGNTRNTEFLTDASEQRIIDSKRPIIEKDKADDSDFELAPAAVSEKPKLKFRELVDIAVRNRRTMGIKQVFLVITLFVMSILMVVSIQEVLSAVIIDKEAVVNKDSRYYRVTAQTKMRTDEAETAAFRTEFGLMTQALIEAGFELYAIPDIVLKYNYEGITQLENYSFEIKDYCFVPLDKIEQDLLYGKMPEDNLEVVVDRLVVEKLLENSGEISDLITDVSQVLGKTISAEQGISMTITGISDTGQPDIYVNPELILMLCRENFIFITEEEVQKKFPEYKSRKLGMTPDGKIEMLVRPGRLEAAWMDYLSSTYEELILIQGDIIKQKEDIMHEGDKKEIKALLDKMDEIYLNIHRLEESNEEVSAVNEKIAAMKEEISEIECSILSYGNEDYLTYALEQLGKLYQHLHEMQEFYGLTPVKYHELIKSRTKYLDYKYDGRLTGDVRYQVIGYYDVEEEADYIVPKEAVPYLEKAIMDYYQSCYVYADAEDVDEMIQKIKDVIPEERKEYLQLKVVNEAKEEVLNYKKEKMEKLQSSILLITAIYVIAVTILYFIMRAEIVEKIQDLSVYRMMGISKRSIVGIFAWENFMITSCTSVPSVFLTLFANFMLERIESLSFSFTYPWYATVLTILFFYVVNILVGILPVYSFLKLPPAQLTAKYDL